MCRVHEWSSNRNKHEMLIMSYSAKAYVRATCKQHNFPLIGTPDWKVKLQLTAVATPWFARVAMVNPPTFNKHILPHEDHTLTCLDPTYVIVLQSIWPGNRSLKVSTVHTFLKHSYSVNLSLIYLFFEGRKWCLSNVISFAFLQRSDFKMSRKNPCQPSSPKTD